jgi:hypothetical protein
METIDDVRREEGNPRASGAAGVPSGAPVPLNRAFSEASMPRAASLVALFLGILCAALGAVTFIVYFWLAALVLLIAALVLFLRVRKFHRPAL